MREQSPELKEAYTALDETIREVIRLEGWEGLVTDWVVVAANQYFDDDGRSMTDVGHVLPDGGNSIPHYRILGLLDYAATGYRSGIGFVADDDEED
jgi:hypothetical protein